MRTTLTLDSDVAAKLKTKMRQTGHSFKQLVNDAIRRGLLADRPESEKRFVVRPYHMGLRPGFSYDNISQLLDQAEGPGHK